MFFHFFKNIHILWIILDDLRNKVLSLKRKKVWQTIFFVTYCWNFSYYFLQIKIIFCSLKYILGFKQILSLKIYIKNSYILWIILDELGNEDTVTFTEMFEEVKLYAAAFRKNGLKKGDTVACKFIWYFSKFILLYVYWKYLIGKYHRMNMKYIIYFI